MKTPRKAAARSSTTDEQLPRHDTDSVYVRSLVGSVGIPRTVHHDWNERGFGCYLDLVDHLPRAADPYFADPSLRQADQVPACDAGIAAGPAQAPGQVQGQDRPDVASGYGSATAGAVQEA